MTVIATLKDMERLSGDTNGITAVHVQTDSGKVVTMVIARGSALAGELSRWAHTVAATIEEHGGTTQNLLDPTIIEPGSVN